MKKLYPIILFLFFMLAVSGLAAGLVTFNASQTQFLCYGGWQNRAYATDELFVTAAYTLPGNAGLCNFYYPLILGFQNGYVLLKSSASEWAAPILPASCVVNGHINLTVVSSYNAVGDSVGVNCQNSTGTQSIYSNGAGDDVGLKTQFFEMQVGINYTGFANCPQRGLDPIYAHDDFSYSDATDFCFWDNKPFKPVYTTNGQLCFNGTAGSESLNYWIGGQGNLYSGDVFTQEYDLSLANESVFMENSLKFSPLANGDFRKSYVIDFQNSGGQISGQFIQFIGNFSTAMHLCSSCFQPNAMAHIKISVYGPQAMSFTALNSSSGMVEAIQPNSISVQINGGGLIFNIPLLEPNSDYGLLPRSASFDIYQGRFCIDNYVLYAGLINSPSEEVNNTGIPFLQVGESCSVNWQCFTNLCNYLGICDRKGFLAACSASYECQSGKCANDKCTKPTIWQSVDQSKTDIAGNDLATNNLVSIIISILAGVALMVSVYRMGGGTMAAVAGGATFLISMFFCALGGWLSPFILIGLVVVLVLLVVFGVILRQ